MNNFYSQRINQQHPPSSVKTSLRAFIDPSNKYRIHNFHPMTSNAFLYVYSLNKPEIINVIQKNSKGKLKIISVLRDTMEHD